MDLTEHVIVLKTVFNDEWDNFNVHDLERTMIQTIHEYTAVWRGRELLMQLSPSDEDFLIASSALSGKNVNVFMKEFGGNTYSSMPYQAVIEKLSSLDLW